MNTHSRSCYLLCRQKLATGVLEISNHLPLLIAGQSRQDDNFFLISNNLRFVSIGLKIKRSNHNGLPERLALTSKNTSEKHVKREQILKVLNNSSYAATILEQNKSKNLSSTISNRMMRRYSLYIGSVLHIYAIDEKSPPVH